MDAFTAEDLRLIKAMCESANPSYHLGVPMFPAWESVYTKAAAMLSEAAQSESEGEEPRTVLALSEDDSNLLTQALYKLNDDATTGERYDKITDMLDRL